MSLAAAPRPKSGIAAFWCFFLAISSLQFSFVFDGINALDHGALLIFPAFLLFMLFLLREWMFESRDYAVGLTLLTAAVVIALRTSYGYAVGTIDDGYHTVKVVAYSVENSFAVKMQSPFCADARCLYIDLAENLWGVVWRYIRQDFVIILIQILPVFVLWRQLVGFFRYRGLHQYAGFLSAVILISMQLLWAQAGSTYIDSTTGFLVALLLLRVFDLLDREEARTFQGIMLTAFVSGLCLLVKPTMLPVGLFGLAVSLWFTLRGCTKRQALVILAVMLPSIVYGAKHVLSIVAEPHGLELLRYASEVTADKGGWYVEFQSQPWFLRFKPFLILKSWLLDYRLGYVTPAPVDVGNGLLWTYIVVPILLLALVTAVVRVKKIRSFRLPAIFLIFVVLFYYFFDFTVVNRFVIGFHIFIAAWALAWAIQQAERVKVPSPGMAAAAGVVLLSLALASFFQSIKGVFYETRIVSVLAAERDIFPKYVNPGSLQEQYCSNLLQKFKDAPVSDKFQSVIRRCELKSYKKPPKDQSRKIRSEEYRFKEVLYGSERF